MQLHRTCTPSIEHSIWKQGSHNRTTPEFPGILHNFSTGAMEKLARRWNASSITYITTQRVTLYCYINAHLHLSHTCRLLRHFRNLRTTSLYSWLFWRLLGSRKGMQIAMIRDLITEQSMMNIDIHLSSTMASWDTIIRQASASNCSDFIAAGPLLWHTRDDQHICAHRS